MPTRFSDHLGITRPPELEMKHVSRELMISLWNAFQPLLFDSGAAHGWRRNLVPVFEYLHWPTHKMSWTESAEVKRLEEWYFGRPAQWYELYNFVQFVVGLLADMIRDREGNPE